MTRSHPEGDERRRHLVSGLFLFTVTAYSLWLAQAQLAFQAGSPADTDLGGHIVAIRHLIEHSLPAGQLQDWSHQWFGGYPTFHFYFPLPALLIAALSALLSLETAAKLVAAAAPSLLPICTWVMVRQSGLSRLHAAGAVVGAVTSLCLTTQYVHGGNILSSVIGEYSYALGFCLALLYLGRLSKAAQSGRDAIVSSVLLGLTALAHLIPTLFAVLASCGFLRNRHVRPQLFTSWVVGFGLSAFWSIPFLVRSRLMADMHRDYHLAVTELLPLPVLMIVPFALPAFALVWRTRRAATRALMALGAGAMLFYFVPQHFFAQGRALPIWYYSVYVLTGIGLAEGLVRYGRDRRFRRLFHTAGVALLIGIGVAQAPLVRARSAVLLSPQRADSGPYDELIETLRELPAGRIHWEYVAGPDKLLGSPVGLARIPYHVSHLNSTFGLLLESSHLTPVFSHTNSVIAQSHGAAGASLLHMLGVDYFVSFTPGGHAWASRQPAYLRPLRSHEHWTVWAIVAAPLVEPVAWTPDQDTGAGWRSRVGAWLSEVEAASDTLIRPNVHGAVRDIVLAHRRIAFVTDAPGAPHLVRIAWFPNWRSDQADGPFRAPPGFMIVVPRQNTVVLRYERTWAEVAGLVITLLTLVGVIAATTLLRPGRH